MWILIRMDARLKALMTMAAILIMCGAFVMMSEEACAEEGASSTLDSNATTYASEPKIDGRVDNGTYSSKYDSTSSTLTITVTANNGYYLPDTVSNTSGKWNPNSSRTSGTLVFTSISPEQTVSFRITCDRPEFSVYVDHGSYSTSYSASDDTYTVTIRANSGYVVPESVTVSSYTSSWGTNGSRSSGYLEIYGVEYDDSGRVNVDCIKVVPVTVSVTTGKTTTSVSLGNAIPGETFYGNLPNKTGYDYPSSISIKAGSSTVSSSRYSYNSSSGSFSIQSSAFSSSTSSITVTANYEAERYSVSAEIQRGDVSYSGSPAYEQSFTIQIIPDDGYAYPDSVRVTNGTTSTGWTYDPDTGIVTISSVKGAIKITGTCDAGTFSIIYHDGNETLDLSPSWYTYNIRCILPEDVEKPSFIFVKWVDSEGNEVTEVPLGTFGEFHVYAKFVDDLSDVNAGLYKTLCYVGAVLSAVCIVALAYVSRK